MTKEMFKEITEWQAKTFPSATAISAAKHLAEEVEEVIADIAMKFDRERVSKEYADCFIILFGSAKLYGLSYEEICAAINEKFEINKQRKWGEVNDKGYIKHVD